MTYDANADVVIELEFERLRSRRHRRSEKMSSSLAVLPAIKMLIGDWYIDELGVLTREITARE
jgi:hypothetical protein